MAVMMMRRVMCVLAVVLCSLVVSGATEAVDGENEISEELKTITDLAGRAVEFVKARNVTKEETLKLKDQCNAAAEQATYLTSKAKEFVAEINELVAKAETDVSDLEVERLKGVKLLENLRWVVANARDTAVLTKGTKMPMIEMGENARNLLYEFKRLHENLKKTTENKDPAVPQDERKNKTLKQLHEKVEAAFPYTDDKSLHHFLFAGIDAADEAQKAALNAETIVKRAQEADNLLQDALGRLSTAVTAAKERIKEITPQENQGSSNNTEDQSAPSDSNPTQQPSPASTTAITGSKETNTTTPPSTENTTPEAPTTTPSPVAVPDTVISSNTIASAVQNKANADRSVSPVWMRTAAPLLIVAVLFSVTVY
ncbi:uncharacterized protein TM35_000571050 [Trypanosoma theileri]|uniref:Mucin-associated surface protein (MASP) n=1 Tax=Trypanosoma theileri TaxID=67003 RepID=A0A1X0NGH4_9TRYP|nr:uncharacterized protein TM35_000571050 [Trypanosoma theileri]ORC83777.1 hypothetical protein TM35_000571050 [Trypanosoma theileri]